MLNITPVGHKEVIAAIVSVYKNIHLFTKDGELSGHGYEPKKLQFEWVEGRYPEIKWIFTEGNEVEIIGWFMTNDKQEVLLTETFDKATDDDAIIIKNNGDIFRVSPNLDFFAGS